MKLLSLFLLIPFFIAQCAGPQPTPTPTCTPPTQPFGGNGLQATSWREWDGSTLTYPTQGGSVYFFAIEGNEVIVNLDPVNPERSTGEAGRYRLEPGTLAAIPMGTEFPTETGLRWIIQGPIFIYPCHDGKVLLDDEHKDLTIEIEGIYPDRIPFPPPEWYGNEREA